MFSLGLSWTLKLVSTTSTTQPPPPGTFQNNGRFLYDKSGDFRKRPSWTLSTFVLLTPKLSSSSDWLMPCTTNFFNFASERVIWNIFVLVDYRRQSLFIITLFPYSTFIWIVICDDSIWQVISHVITFITVWDTLDLYGSWNFLTDQHFKTLQTGGSILTSFLTSWEWTQHPQCNTNIFEYSNNSHRILYIRIRIFNFLFSKIFDIRSLPSC